MGSKVTGFDKGDMIVADVGSEYSDISFHPAPHAPASEADRPRRDIGTRVYN